MRSFQRLTQFTLLAAVVVLNAQTTAAQERLRRLPPTTITIDEDALAAFVDEPCRHFEAARDQFLARKYHQAAKHLRTAAAYLRLELARADKQSRTALEASMRELQSLATATERGKIESVEKLKQAFARAHYALASHHCVQTAHRCCQAEEIALKVGLTRAGHDLRAAAIHLERGSQWAGKELDKETRKTLQLSRAAAKALIERKAPTQSSIQRSIHSLHKKLESLTGRKILLARPITPDSNEGAPSIFR